MKTTSRSVKRSVLSRKSIQNDKSFHAMPLLRMASISAVATFAILSAVGCGAAEPESDMGLDGEQVALDTEKVDTSESDLVKGCGTGKSLCAVEYDPDLGQISICCNTSTEVCQDGACVPKPTRALEQGTALPKYKVLGLVYSAPGRESEVRYSASSSFGTHTDTSNSYKTGVVVNFESTVLDINTQFAATHFSGTEFEQKKTSTYAYSQAASPDRTTDELVPQEDNFYVWLNPKVEVKETSPLVYQFKLGAENNTPDAVWISVNEINNPALIPAWKQTKLNAAGINGTDLQNIKALDPVATGVGLSNPDRFKLVAQLPLLGPSYAGGDIPGNFFGIDNEQVKSVYSGAKASISVEILVGFELAFFGTSGLKTGGLFEWEHEAQSAIVNGESQGAEVKLSTDTVGYMATYDIYYDTIFRVFAFKKVSSLAGSPVLAGVISSADGQPAANERVLVRMPDGQSVYTVTDGEGRYQMLNMPAGEVEVVARQFASKVDVGGAGLSELNVRMGAEQL